MQRTGRIGWKLGLIITFSSLWATGVHGTTIDRIDRVYNRNEGRFWWGGCDSTIYSQHQAVGPNVMFVEGSSIDFSQIATLNGGVDRPNCSNWQLNPDRPHQATGINRSTYFDRASFITPNTWARFDNFEPWNQIYGFNVSSASLLDNTRVTVVASYGLVGNMHHDIHWVWRIPPRTHFEAARTGPATQVRGAQSKVVIGRIELTEDSAMGVKVGSIRVRLADSTARTTLRNFEIYRDSNSNGQYDSSADILLGGVQDQNIGAQTVVALANNRSSQVIEETAGFLIVADVDTTMLGSQRTLEVRVGHTDLSVASLLHDKVPSWSSSGDYVHNVTLLLCPAGPQVTSILPSSGPCGTEITLSGANFTSGTTITLDGILASTQFDDTQTLRATTPDALPLGSIDVVVKNPASSGCPSIETTVVDGFTRTVPLVNRVVPGAGLRNEATPVVVQGEGFSYPGKAWFGTEVVTVSSGNATSFSVDAPAQLGVDCVNVVFQRDFCPHPSSPLAAGFCYQDGPPTITGLLPDRAPSCEETQIVVTGSNFTEGSTVQFGTIEAVEIVFESSSRLLVTTPPLSAGSVTVSVETGIGTPAMVAFEFLSVLPSILELDPPQVPYPGTSLTIRGQNFCDGITVEINGTDVDVLWVSSTEILAEAPAIYPQDCHPEFVVSLNVTNPSSLAVRYAPGLQYHPLKTIHVSSAVASPTPDGSLANPYPRIQDAIDLAVDGDAIVIDPSKKILAPDYNEHITTMGKKILLTSRDRAPIDRPVISAVLDDTRIITANSGEGSETVIACLELRSGRGGVLVDLGASPLLYDLEIHDQGGDPGFPGSEPIDGDGGAILVRGGSSPKIQRCRIHTNWVTGHGAGIAVLDPGSAAEIELNSIWGCESGGSGGGLYIGPDTDVAKIEKNNIYENTAEGEGGGIFCGADLDPTESLNTVRRITNNRIEDNSGSGIVLAAGVVAEIHENLIQRNLRGGMAPHGGGISCDGSVASTQVTITSNRVLNNEAIGPCSQGGGIYLRAVQGANMVAFLENNEICGNVSQVGGGLYLNTKVDATIRRNIIAFNEVKVLEILDDNDEPLEMTCPWQAEGDDPEHLGAGVFMNDCAVLFDNNTVHRNRGAQADSGGGLHARRGFFSNSKVRNNIFSENQQSGLFLELAPDDVPLRGNAFFGNTASACAGNCPPGWNAFPINLLGFDPLFVDRTRCERLALRPESPLRDAGEPEIPSPVDDRVDIGAVEHTRLAAAKVGTVGLRLGDPSHPVIDTLFVNESAGGITRIVTVPVGSDLFLRIDPPAGGNGAYVIHARQLAPGESDATDLPADVGLIAFPLVLPPGDEPATWNTLGQESLVGPNRDLSGNMLPGSPPLAPTTLLVTDGGVPYHPIAGTEIYFQGVSIDRDARPRARRPVSITNGVLVRIQ